MFFPQLIRMDVDVNSVKALNEELNEVQNQMNSRFSHPLSPEKIVINNIAAITVKILRYQEAFQIAFDNTLPTQDMRPIHYTITTIEKEKPEMFWLTALNKGTANTETSSRVDQTLSFLANNPGRMKQTVVLNIKLENTQQLNESLLSLKEMHKIAIEIQKFIENVWIGLYLKLEKNLPIDALEKESAFRFVHLKKNTIKSPHHQPIMAMQLLVKNNQASYEKISQYLNELYQYERAQQNEQVWKKNLLHILISTSLNDTQIHSITD